MGGVREVMTPQQVADYLQITPATVYRYIRQGKLVASSLGRSYRIRKRDVNLFLMSTATSGGARLRTFSRDEIDEWLREDAIDDETRAMGEHLSHDLRARHGSSGSKRRQRQETTSSSRISSTI